MILDRVSFSALKGQITTLIGLNGSGKTTLLSSILRERKYEGEVFIGGVSSNDLTRREMARRISLMPQILPSPDVSVEALVSFARSPYTSFSGILTAEDDEKVLGALEEMKISHLAQRNVRSLSGGERQRAYFAMLLAQDTDIVMTDEPTTYMDAPTRKELFSFLNLLKGRQKAVITVLHDLNDAISISDRILLIDGGRLIFSGSADEFAASPLPKEIFGMEAFRSVVDGKEILFFR